MNPRSDPNKKPPCSFKGNCKKFLAKEPCNFSHDPCPFMPKCKFGQKCKYYHPQINGNTSSQSQSRPFNPSPDGQRKPVRQTQCRFGMNCKKRLTGQCHFLHVQNTNQSQPVRDVSNDPCKFGANCIKFSTGTCRYYHSQSDHNQTQNTQMKVYNQGPQNSSTLNQQTQFVSSSQSILPSRNFPINSSRAFENSMCMKYAYNQCNSQESQCPQRKKHAFTNQNTIKRIFFNGKQPLNTITGCHFLPIDRATFLTVHIKQRLIFMKFNQVTKQLEPLSDLILKEATQIIKLIIENSLIVYFVKSINYDLVFYKPKTGRIQRIKNAHFNDILGLAYVETNKILISIAKGQKANVFLEEQQTEEGKLKFNSTLQINGSYNHLNFIKKVILMDEQIIVGGTQSGKICIWNNRLDGKVLNIQTPKQLQDVQCAVCNGHPYCLVSVLDVQKQTSQVISIDILSFQTFTVLENKSNTYKIQMFKKMLVLNQLFLVQIATGNILIYKLPNLNQRIGIIPLNNQAISLQKQKDCSKFCIAQKSGGQTEGSFSIYKIST